MAIEFITTREISGKFSGKVRIVKLAEEPEAQIECTCPECGFSEKRKEKWSEPLVSGAGANKKFNIKCNKCSFEIKFVKLKKEK
jgi:DNA-directed RNA polymerase subunit RPC12/RpoP